MRVAARAVRVDGGCGYRKGAVVERCFCYAKTAEIHEESSEVQRMAIARSMLAGDRWDWLAEGERSRTKRGPLAGPFFLGVSSFAGVRRGGLRGRASSPGR